MEKPGGYSFLTDVHRRTGQEASLRVYLEYTGITRNTSQTKMWNLSKAETILLCFQFQENTISCLKEADFVSTHNDLHRPLVGPLITQEGTSEAELINTMLNDEKLRNVANSRPW